MDMDMDIVEAANDFQDWELLQSNSDSESDPVSPPYSGNPFDEIDSGCLIQADYFSSDLHDRYEEERMDDDNPGWIDPGLGDYLTLKESGSGSERSEDRKFSELEETNESGFPENGAKFELTDEKGIDGDSAENSQVGVDFHVESQVLGEETEGIVSGDLQAFGEEMNENEGGIVDGRVKKKKKSGEVEKRGVVWWKMPMEFLKYCMIRMSPVWTVSVAAAVVGFVILGRRLHKMKRKARGLEIKVAVDDKKASLAMSRAARLNEAFSVVKLVPVIRPSLPAVGSSSNWTVMSLR